MPPRVARMCQPLVVAAAALLWLAATVWALPRLHDLPDALRRPPRLSDYDLRASLPGTLADPAALARKPRAVIGYLSNKEWAFFEFLCMAHASWRYVGPLAAQNGLQIDIIVFTSDRWLKEVSSICTPLDLADARDRRYAGLFGGEPNCLVIRYPEPPAAVWHGYPFINNVHYFADPLVGELLANYGYAMKTDFDTFLTPTLIQHFPQRYELGAMEYAVLPATAERLARVAADLGLRHRGAHNLGPTWYADVPTLVAVANLSIPIMYHIYSREFEQRPGGGLVQNWQAGDGWPLWNAGALAMYASELALNHLVQDWSVSDKYDHHGDSERFTFTLYHVHCRHGDGNFSKFEFFKHHYDGVDVNALDFHVVKNYALSLAVSTWRHVQELQAAQLGQAGAERQELR